MPLILFSMKGLYPIACYAIRLLIVEGEVPARLQVMAEQVATIAIGQTFVAVNHGLIQIRRQNAVVK